MISRRSRPGSVFALAGLAACTWLLHARAAESPGDFANHVPIPADGSRALYRFALTADVYRGAADPGLADLRVFNGAGEPIPFAFYPRQVSRPSLAAPVPVRFFALPLAAPGASAAGVHVQTDSAGAVLRIDVARPGTSVPQAASPPSAFLVDASALPGPIQAFTLAVKSAGDLAAKVRVESSNDLETWRPLVADAGLLRLQHGTERLEHLRIDLPAAAARYFRLTWSGMPADASLDAVLAQAGQAPAEALRQWTPLAPLAGAAKPGEYAFDSAGHFPADRLRIALPEANTVVAVEVFARARADQQWRPLVRQTCFRLNAPGGEITSPPLVVPAAPDRYWLLRVDPRAGGVGSGIPQPSIGWIPQEIAFAARGAPPYELAFGSNRASAAAIAIEALIPGYRGAGGSAADPDPPSGAAALEAVPVQLAPLAEPAQPPPKGIFAGGAMRAAALWAALAGGVGMLAWMAWRLVRQMNAPGPGA